MRGLRAVLALALVLALGGCGASGGFPGLGSGGECPGVARPLSELSTSADSANVFLYVTNQSFEDPVVRVVVDVEGQTVVDQAFDVCGQHNWVAFPLALPTGWHDLSISTHGDVVTRTRVDVPPSPGKRWVVVSYWTDPERSVDVNVSSEPVGFA
jgi:hypothetical protein